MSRDFEPNGVRPSSQDPLHGGSIDGQRFVLVRRLGRGGTGEVHEGLLNLLDGSTNRVAIKVLVDDPTDEPGRLRDFVEFSKDFRHPNVLAPFEFIPSSGGRVLLTRFVEGLPLVEVQRRMKRLGRPLPVSLVLEIILQTLNGLAYLHSAAPGSTHLHKCVKPSNLLIGADGIVRILDVGVNNPFMDVAQRNKGLAVLSVLPYMAPEQLNDGPKVSLTPSTDLYSLATVAYELLAGRLLFDGSAARRELEIRVGFGVQDKLRALDVVVPGISPILVKSLALVQGERYPSAAEMARALMPLRPESQQQALGELLRELQALPEKPLSMSRPADATTQVGRSEPRSTEIRDRLEAPTMVRHVEPVPAHLLARSRPSPARDMNLKVGLGVFSLAIAFGALWWVDQSRRTGPLERGISADSALISSKEGAAKPAPARDGADKAAQEKELDPASGSETQKP